MFYLQDPMISAHQLHAGGYDVFVCSYEFVETSGRDMPHLPNSLDHYVNSASSTLRVSTRPTSALHSVFWRHLNLPSKRLVLDECQVVNKRDGARHQALKKLFVKGTILLSGILTHNKWHDLSGLVDFLKRHSIKDHHGFIKHFSAVDAAGSSEDIEIVGMKLLQRFMQAFTIAQPSHVVKLKDCKQYSAMLRLLLEEAEEAAKLTRQYVSAVASSRSEEQESPPSSFSLIYYTFLPPYIYRFRTY